MFELNRSGKYHAMKERLKSAASAIIAERSLQGGAGRQGKYNELYVHLVQEMHAALKKLGSSEEEPGDPRDGVDHAKLARFKALADEYGDCGRPIERGQVAPRKAQLTRADSRRSGRNTERFWRGASGTASPRRRIKRRSCSTRDTCPRSSRSARSCFTTRSTNAPRFTARR